VDFILRSLLDINQMTNSELINKKQCSTWWLTGLSGAGKTTLAKALAASLQKQGCAVCVLDGDEIRQGLSKDLGFSIEDREEQGRRVAEMAKLLNQNGIHAIVALISPTKLGRTIARTILGPAMKEVYVATPLKICKQRDAKGLYAKAELNNTVEMTGIQVNYEIPENPEYRIEKLHLPDQHLLNVLINL
jgi:adenylylsulfate kinase